MANPDFSIVEFLAWARTKPADASYNYLDGRDCALCHFLRETDRSPAPVVSPYLGADDATAGWMHTGESLSALRRYPFAIEGPLADGDETFGALVTRLEALLPAISDTWTRADAYLIGVVA